MRRKYLGSDHPSCFYCDQSDIDCLELDHPLGREHDEAFTRIVCSNCHRKSEAERDLARLTKNGQHRVPGTELTPGNYLLRLAEDLIATSESARRQAALWDKCEKRSPDRK